MCSTRSFLKETISQFFEGPKLERLDLDPLRTISLDSLCLDFTWGCWAGDRARSYEFREPSWHVTCPSIHDALAVPGTTGGKCLDSGVVNSGTYPIRLTSLTITADFPGQCVVTQTFGRTCDSTNIPSRLRAPLAKAKIAQTKGPPLMLFNLRRSRRSKFNGDETLSLPRQR